MDKASDFESGDCRFESCQSRFYSQVKREHITLFFKNYIHTLYLFGISPILNVFLSRPRSTIWKDERMSIAGFLYFYP